MKKLTMLMLILTSYITLSKGYSYFSQYGRHEPILDFALPDLEECMECGPGGQCSPEYNKKVEGGLYCVTCGEGYVVNGNICTKLKPCDEECGKGGLCYMKGYETICETCGVGMVKRGDECKNTEPCDQCGPGGQCYLDMRVPDEGRLSEVLDGPELDNYYDGYYDDTNKTMIEMKVCSSCAPGYASSRDYTKCMKMEDCETECGPGGKCVKEDGKFVRCISCGEGYEYQRKGHCTKERNCDTECGKGDVCYNGKDGSLECIEKSECEEECSGRMCRGGELYSKLSCLDWCLDGYAYVPFDSSCSKLRNCEHKCGGKGGKCYDVAKHCKDGDEKCIQYTTEGLYHRKYHCKECGDGHKLNFNQECVKLETNCEEECGKGGLCYEEASNVNSTDVASTEKVCETCGEGRMFGRNKICRKLTPCDNLCGPGGKCFENGVYCAKCGEGYESSFGSYWWSRKTGEGGCKPKVYPSNGMLYQFISSQKKKDDTEAENVTEGAKYKNMNATGTESHIAVKKRKKNKRSRGMRRF